MRPQLRSPCGCKLGRRVLPHLVDLGVGMRRHAPRVNAKKVRIPRHQPGVLSSLIEELGFHLLSKWI